MSNRDSAYQITKAILGELGGDTSLVYTSTYKVVEAIYYQLGGNETDFESTYQIVLAILEGLENGTITPGTPVSGTLEITINGDYDVSQYASASVNVAGGGIIPSGSLTVVVNGDYDVTNYASASVNVPQGVFPSGTLNIIANGDYEVNQYESASVSVPGPSGSIAITANGDYDVAAYESASVNVAGGGAEIITDFSEAPLSVKCVQAGTLVGTNRLSGKTRYYSLDGGSTWTVLDENTTLNLSEGDVISLGGNWGSGGMASDSNPNPLFEGTALVDVFGNIDSLIDKENFAGIHSGGAYYSGNYVFKRLFEGNTQIRNCYNLVLPCPDTFVNNQKSTYGGMFKGSSITVAPQEIAATTLGYESCLEMFRGCTHLTKGSKIKATKFLGNYVCAHMYRECSALVEVPNFENIVQVSSGTFEQMFGQCTSLEVAPPFPLYAIASRICDRMFSDCTSLKAAPELPYTGTIENSAYVSMFTGCSNLEYAPELPALTIGSQACKEMFYGCRKLKRYSILATEITAANGLQDMFRNCSNFSQLDIAYVTSSVATSGYSNWLLGVSGSGVINVNATYANQSQYPLNSDSGVPTGWTVVAEQPFTIPA